MENRRIFLTTAIASVAVAALPSRAQTQYPAKPVRLVVPFPPGGTTDQAARVIAQPLGEALGQTIIIDNKAGADGVIAGEAVMKAAPDGYTLLFGTATGLSAAPAMRKSAPYDPVADFTPISRTGTFGFFLYINDSLPARTMPELMAYVRANPGKLNYGTSSATSIVATAQFAQLAKLDMVHIPYKGDAPLTIDIIGGRVHLMFAAGSALPHVQSGKLRVIATLLPKRSPLAPEAPTMAEVGLTNLSINPWGGMLGPAGLPRDIVDRLGHEMSRVLARVDVQDQLGRLAFDPQSSTSEELGALVKDQLGVWRKAVRDAGIPIE